MFKKTLEPISTDISFYENLHKTTMRVNCKDNTMVARGSICIDSKMRHYMLQK